MGLLKKGGSRVVRDQWAVVPLFARNRKSLTNPWFLSRFTNVQKVPVPHAMQGELWSARICNPQKLGKWLVLQKAACRPSVSLSVDFAEFRVLSWCLVLLPSSLGEVLPRRTNNFTAESHSIYIILDSSTHPPSPDPTLWNPSPYHSLWNAKSSLTVRWIMENNEYKIASVHLMLSYNAAQVYRNLKTYIYIL